MLVFISHPIAGNHDHNIKEVLKIIKSFRNRTSERQLTPVAPYVAYIQSLDDSNPDDREIGLKWNFVVLKNCSALLLYGDKVSEGMKREITVAIQANIPVVPMTKETESDFQEFVTEQQYDFSTFQNQFTIFKSKFSLTWNEYKESEQRDGKCLRTQSM